MFHAAEENKLYNFTTGVQTEVTLKSGTQTVEIDTLLDDISIWMEKHGDIIKDKYFPFACLASGLVPSQASAFVYGCFVGRTMEKKKITVQSC